jgi:hypothetical protein
MGVSEDEAQECLNRQIQSFASLSSPTDVQKVLWQYTLMGKPLEYGEYGGGPITQSFKNLHVKFVFNEGAAHLEILDKDDANVASIFFRK